MADDRFAINLQQDIVSLLCYSDQHGKTIARTIDVNLMEGDFRTITERTLEFWKKYNVAPKQHVADLFTDILESKHDRRAGTYRRLLIAMSEVQATINADFVLRSMDEFIRMQRAKSVILKAAEQLDARGINGLQETEDLLNSFLRERSHTIDAGIRLNDIDKILAYLDNAHSEFRTGIKELDHGNIVPMRGKVLLFLAPTGKGKSWFMVQLGKMAFTMRKKVCHITLEIEAEEVGQRYYQALFGASKRDDESKITTIKFDNNGRLSEIGSDTVNVPFTFNSRAIREELQTRVNHFGTRAGNVLIKRFPMRSLTVEQLESYLESLEAVEHFSPDLLIVDYPKIMKTDPKNPRISIGILLEDLRGLAQRRNFALAAVHQTSKVSVDADMVQATHVAEDWSMIATSDIVITYSQTSAENRYGLARLYVAKARSEEDKFGVLITQNYKTGQFVLESTRLSDSYAHLMERMSAQNRDEEVADDESE